MNKKVAVYVLSLLLIAIGIFGAIKIMLSKIPPPADGEMQVNSIENEFLNAKNEGVIKEKIGIIYSHPFDKKTDLLVIKNQQEIFSQSYDIDGITEIHPKKQGIVLVSEEFNFHEYELNRKFELINKKKVRSPFSFYHSDDEIEIRSFNIDVKKNIVDINDLKKKKTYQVTLPPLLIQAEYDDNFVYVFCDYIEKQSSYLYLIDRNQGKLVKTIPIAFNHANDLLIFNNKLIMTTKEKLSILDIKTHKLIYLDYPSNNITTDKLYEKDQKLYMSYYDDYVSAGTLVYDANLNLLHNKKLHFPYELASFNNGKLFILTQLHSKDPKRFGGIIASFRLEDFKKEGQMILPKKKWHIQNFAILDF
ncbi:hypothetical protein [Lihuaxuella thermophila]|uniref:Uncharacterized protein n=1 Tax=Lihuaxuella thermophila TaxID=1173111 RepID=A0A1H8IHF7_9BACL|nr:hypothetical protein [Lihuaxuella thermophila]SEN67791.1 hypothetical protein SAMN05444955_11783 [Lihuaxuella thermophila]